MTNNPLNTEQKTSVGEKSEDKAKVAPAAGQPIDQPEKTPPEVTPPTKS